MVETSAAPAKRIVIDSVSECGYCGGHGTIRTSRRLFECRACDGRGVGQTVAADAICPHCRGGKRHLTTGETCRNCTGTGVRSIVDWRAVFLVGSCVLGIGLTLSTRAPGLLLPSAILGCMGAMLMGVSVHSGRQRLAAQRARAELRSHPLASTPDLPNTLDEV